MSASTRIPRFNVKKIVKCKLALDQSVLSTLHRGGEGQIAYKLKFPTLVTKVVVPRKRFCTFCFQLDGESKR